MRPPQSGWRTASALARSSAGSSRSVWSSSHEHRPALAGTRQAESAVGSGADREAAPVGRGEVRAHPLLQGGALAAWKRAATHSFGALQEPVDDLHRRGALA